MKMEILWKIEVAAVLTMLGLGGLESRKLWPRLKLFVETGERDELCDSASNSSTGFGPIPECRTERGTGR